MSRLQLTFAGRDYDRTMALIDGRVKPRGIDLNYLVIEDPDSIFRRMIEWQEFDSSELSLSTYLAIRARRDKRFIAIPAFPSRLFRHSYILCNVDSRINEPADLVGKKVGVKEWQQTAAVWMKGLLQHEYGVPLKRIRWLRFAQERYSQVKPKSFRIESAADLDSSTSEERAGKALEEGEIDALLTARLPEFFYGSKKIKRLFGDWFRIEADYFKRTRIFPIMHTVVMKIAVYEAHAWSAESMLDAFKEAKELGQRRVMSSGDKVSNVWGRHSFEEQLRVMGSDPYPYNLKDNKEVIETLMQYQVEQEIIDRELRTEEMFAPNTLD